MKPIHIVLICVAPFAFVAWVIFVLNVVSMLSGWRRLAQKYPALREPEGARFKMQSARIGFSRYNHVLIFVSAVEGLFMRVSAPFHFGHAAILIPWREIHNQHEGKRLWAETVRFDVGSPALSAIELPKENFKKIFGSHSKV